MGGDYFDDIVGTQPRGGFQQPRASDYDQFWHPSGMRQPASPNESRGEGERSKARARKVEETPVRMNVRTIVVEDGDAKEAQSRKAPLQASQSLKTPKASQGRKAPAVRFESSDAAALKIQAVYRGYSVRRTEPLKHLRVICKVKAELQELMRKSCQPEEMEKIREDPQVRLIWTEGIMTLILRLDSLQGVHPAVRVIRKSMAKDVICFQERIDSMADAVKEKMVVDNVDPVEEDSNVEPENEDIAIAEDTNVRDSETEKDTALHTEHSSDSSVSPVHEESIEEVSSLHIVDDVHGKNVENTPEVESLIETPENHQEIGSSADSQVGDAMSMVEEAPSAVESTSMCPEKLQESLISRDDNPEVTNAKDAAQCTCLPKGDLEQAGDGYAGDVSTTSTEDQELSTSPLNASHDATVAANRPSWASLITEPHQGDSLSDPPTTADDSSLSDRALLLRILEENRKLKAVVGEVLQWGKQQNEVIHNLTSKVKQLEGDVSNVKLLKNRTHSSRRRAGSIAGPIGDRERVVRNLESGYGRQTIYMNEDEQWPSLDESEEFF